MNRGISEMKSIPAYWALLTGLLSVIAQGIFYFLRFGQWNTQSPFSDYLFFFLAGSLGGLILVFFLNRQTSSRGRWIVMLMFLLISPISLFFMLGGGLFGPFGLLLLPQVPWGLFSWLGSLLARFVSRPGKKQTRTAGRRK
jgi:hypothetical protein